MTNLTLTYEPEEWYNRQWLVLILCLLVFPVGLYALWKSGKITKGWKVAGTIIVATGVMGAAGMPVMEIAKNNAEKTTTAPVEEKKDAGVGKYLFASADEFKAAFNKRSDAHDLNLTINEPTMTKGEVRNSFKYMLTGHLGLIGSMDRSTGRVIELMMLGPNDGTAASGAELLSYMGAIIATVDTSLTRANRKEVLEDMGLFDKTQDLSDISRKTDRNGIHYYIESNKVTGFIFGVSKK